MHLTQRPPSSTQTPAFPLAVSRPRAVLSPRQLFDVELGLFLLSQLMPAAPPDYLPVLLADAGSAERTWTGRQRRTLGRGRAMLQPCMKATHWNDLLDRYSRLTNQMQAFDISYDQQRFNQKTVGFFRNRVRTLRQLLA